MKYKGLNDNKVTVEAGISNGLIGKGRKRGGISQENISKILCTYPEINANWLLTGEGEMLKTGYNAGIVNSGSYNNIGSMGSNVVSIQRSPAKSINQRITGRIVESNDPAKYEISSLKSEIQHLKQELLSKDKIIATQEELINMYKASSKQ
ncbi:MAG: hypothetical protein LBK69_01545 [Syntrophomonadaceae bacterium]|jgi:hypothetical protein|nr:hypothetical protein [Syntrophomonadaceae bacterium]